MGKELITVRDGPHDIKEYVEEYLKYNGPKPGRFVVTRVRGKVDVEYALKPGTMETILREVGMEFDVTALSIPNPCLEIELHAMIAYDGKPYVDHWKLGSTCPHDWFGWEFTI